MPLLHGGTDDVPAACKAAELDEIAIIAERFIARGVTRIRLSGGEPLVRRDVADLVRRLGTHVGHGLDELTMTTNGTRLAEHADTLASAGIRRINVSPTAATRSGFATSPGTAMSDRSFMASSPHAMQG